FDITKTIQFEEAGFLDTIGKGLELYEEARLRGLRAGNRISGKDVFELHTTYGFPPDLTRQMAYEGGMTIDEKRYQELMVEQEPKSRGKGESHQVALNVSGGLPETDDRPKWHGMQTEAKVLGWIADNQLHKSGAIPDGQEVGLLLDRTCFYAEQG